MINWAKISIKPTIPCHAGLPTLYADYVAACTYEGENNVMFLQTARWDLLILCWFFAEKIYVNDDDDNNNIVIGIVIVDDDDDDDDDDIAL